MSGKRTRRKGQSRGRKELPKSLRRVNLDAAGIDIGSKSHYVAVPEGRDEHPVRKFRSFTTDLRRLADWLEKCGIDTVAMESTSVYWIPLYEILEERGFNGARHRSAELIEIMNAVYGFRSVQRSSGAWGG